MARVSFEKSPEFLQWFYDNLDIGSVTDVYKKMAQAQYEAIVSGGHSSSLRRSPSFHSSFASVNDHWSLSSGARSDLTEEQQTLMDRLKTWRRRNAPKEHGKLPDWLLKRMIVERPTLEEMRKFRFSESGDLQNAERHFAALTKMIAEAMPVEEPAKAEEEEDPTPAAKVKKSKREHRSKSSKHKKEAAAPVEDDKDESPAAQ